MADLYAGPDIGSPALDATDDAVAVLFRTRYPEMVRLADLLGADDPEDIAQEAFARLIGKHGSLRDPGAALAYVRASVCNLTRNRHRHLRVVRLRTPAGHDVDSSEQIAMFKADHREVLAALAELPPRRREAIVLRYPGSGRTGTGAGGQGMNTIEDRLRDALRERAAHSPIDPHAWARTVARSRRRPGRVAPGWSRVMIPVAAAAAVVAIVVGATALTGRGGPRGGSGATGSGPRAPLPRGSRRPLARAATSSRAIRRAARSSRSGW